MQVTVAICQTKKMGVKKCFSLDLPDNLRESVVVPYQFPLQTWAMTNLGVNANGNVFGVTIFNANVSLGRLFNGNANVNSFSSA